MEYEYSIYRKQKKNELISLLFTIHLKFFFTRKLPKEFVFVPPLPPLTNSPSQLLAVKHNAIHKLFGGQFLAVLFHKRIDIIFIHFKSHDLDQNTNLLHRYRLKPLNVLQPKLLPSRSEGSLGNSFPRLFGHLEAINDVEVIFPKLSESKIGFPLSSSVVMRNSLN